MQRKTKEELLKIKQEITEHYTDLAGMVTPDSDPGYATTLNGLMHKGYLMVLYSELGILDRKDVEEFRQVVISCEDAPGLYDRYPRVNELPKIENMNAHDDTRGVVAGSVVCDLYFHEDVLKYGLSNLFFYDNENESSFLNNSLFPSKWNWSGVRLRMWKDISWYFLVNKTLRILTPLMLLAFTIQVLVGKVKYNQILDYMLVISMSRVSWIWNKFKLFYMRKSKLYASTVNYFGASHPISQLALEVENNARSIR